MTRKPSLPPTKNRTYTKLIVVWSLAAINALAFFHVDADALAVVGSTDVALIGLYMGIGHKDLKTWVASGLLDLRRKGPTQ